MAILGRFRCPLEVTECTLTAVALVFLKSHFFTKIELQEPSWTELGANFGAQEAQHGGQEAPKTGPKIDQKNDQKKARFLRVPGGAPRESMWGGYAKIFAGGAPILARLSTIKLLVGTKEGVQKVKWTKRSNGRREGGQMWEEGR